MIIAIDGVSGAGKSSLAKEVAKELDFGFFSAGYFYRAITFEALKRNITDDQDDMLNILMNNLDIKLLYDENKSLSMIVNGEDITSHLHTEEISTHVAKYSRKPYIREKVRILQRETKNYNSGIVMEGRDIGSVIFPDADIKIYVTCSARIRAERRVTDYEKNGEMVNIEQVEQELIERDYRDMHRSISPLKKCDDAILIDTSNKSVLECAKIVVDKALSIMHNQQVEKNTEIISVINHFDAKVARKSL